MKQQYKYFNGYTREAVNEEYAKNATLPQYGSKMTAFRSTALENTIIVEIYHHVNDGSTECNCYKCAPRELSRVASTIKQDWEKPYFGAVPYIQAMYSLSSVKDDYGADSGHTIVLYGLSNMTTWRGIVAKCVKAELNYYLKK